MGDIYLVKRGPRPDHHRAPFHPVIITGKRRLMEWEADWSGAHAWVWEHERGRRAGGWLITRWNGLAIDYGHVVRGFTLPDGTEAAFSHEHRGGEPWPLLAGAVWWDDRRMPAWLEEAGVVYPPDHFSQQVIVNAIAGNGQWERPVPDFWPTPEPLVTWEVEDGARIPNGTVVDFEEGIGCYATPARATVEALTATLERPNGRYVDSYHLRFEDGRETRRYRYDLEKRNPHLVLTPDAAPAGEVGDG